MYVVVMIVWYLDILPLVQSVPITTKVVSSNTVHDEVYSIQDYVMKFASDLRQISVFSGHSSFLYQWNTPPWYEYETLLQMALNAITQPAMSYLSEREKIWATIPYKYIMVIITYVRGSQSSHWKACTIDNYLE